MSTLVNGRRSTVNRDPDGTGVVWVEGGTRVVWVAGGAVGAEAPTPAAVLSRRDRTSANLARFYAFNTIPTPKEGELRT